MIYAVKTQDAMAHTKQNTLRAAVRLLAEIGINILHYDQSWIVISAVKKPAMPCVKVCKTTDNLYLAPAGFAHQSVVFSCDGYTVLQSQLNIMELKKLSFDIIQIKQPLIFRSAE